MARTVTRHDEFLELMLRSVKDAQWEARSIRFVNFLHEMLKDRDLNLIFQAALERYVPEIYAALLEQVIQRRNT
jgi:hypothetical protein